MPREWLEYGALGILAFIAVSVMSLGSWFIRHVTPKAIDAFSDNVRLQKVISDNLIAHGERLIRHDEHAAQLAAAIRGDIHDFRTHVEERLDEQGRKIDRAWDWRKK